MPRSPVKVVLLALAVALAGAACSKPTEPRIPPSGEDPKDPPKRTQGFDPRSSALVGLIFV
jgi:hypothetical protein